MIDINSVLDVVKFRFYQEWLYVSHLKSKVKSSEREQFIKKNISLFFDPLNLPKNAAIIDVSPNNACFLDELKKREYNNYLGVSLLEDEIKLCKEKDHKIVKHDFSWLPQNKGFTDESLNLIWCQQILTSSPYPIFTLIEFNRLLRYFGKVYIEVPAPNNKIDSEYALSNYSVFSEQQWRALFDKTGFKVEQFQQLGYSVVHEDTEIEENYYCFMISKQQALDIK